ncbi:MAG TPA: GNAT family N-acetyltransferase [Steroidobacteraceae bacterium]|nr:GNAT family N-acetyltransferase [Steroidobacteraceae bacterium]
MEQIAYTPEAWSTVEAPWGALICALRIQSAFMSLPWMRAWWEVFGPELKPRLLVWRDATDQPVGICVLTRGTRRVGGIPLRTAWLGATSDELVQSEHNDLLVLPSYRARAIADIAALLKREGVQRLRLRGFSPSLVREFHGTAFCSPTTGFESEDRYADLEALRRTGQPYLQSLTSGARRQIKRSMREYTQRHGEVVLERASSAAQRQADMQDLRELHQRRWSSRGVNSAFLNDAAIRFHQQLLDSSAGDGEPHMDSFHIDLLRIRAGRQTLGVLYMLLYAGRANLYQCGLSYDDNDSDNKLAPGLLSHALAIEHYLQRGFAEYDFLAGEEKSVRYKTTLGAQSRSLVWKDCYVPGPSTVLVRTLRTVWRRSRQLVGAAT